MSVPTTRATTHANDKQHGTRKRIDKKHTLESYYEQNKNKGTLRLRKIMFSGDGREELY